MIRVLIADDSALVRHGLQLLLGDQPDLVVAGLARDGVQAVAMAITCSPDMVLMDLSMPRMDGLSATREILLTSPWCPVLVLTGSSDPDALAASLMAGAVGCVRKGDGPEALLRAIRHAVGPGRA
jgi:DNA-binding NarL/FixJ family response regulator